MFSKRIPVKLFTTYVLLIHATIQNDCLQLTRNNESEKNNFNSKLSVIVNYFIKSVKSTSSSIRVVACDSYFQDDINDVMQHWRVTVSLTLLNMEKNYRLQKVIPKTDFILMLLDERIDLYLGEFMKKMMGRIRKHKVLVVLKTSSCDHING